MIQQAIEHDKPVRIGVNWGNLDQSLAVRLMDENNRRAQPLPPDAVMREALIVSALDSADKAMALGLAADKILLSCKVSHVQDLIAVYRELARRCDFPLHLGLTEAGMGSKGIVASSAALAVLLQEGIGDTIRISLTPSRARRAKRSDRRPGAAANHGPARLHPAGHRLSGLRAHHQHLLSGAGGAHSILAARGKCRSGGNNTWRGNPEWR